MEKLELKHLAGYLPYGLKMYYPKYKETHVLVGLRSPYKTNDKCFLTCELRLENSTKLRSHVFNITNTESDCKPILRPLSDLTKEIEVNGEKFIPINKINTLNICDRDVDEHLSFGGGGSWEGGYEDGIDSFQFYLIFQKLLEWHIDIDDLIGKKLAIDINTLK